MRKINLLILLITYINLFSQTDVCKIRLPEHINNYTPQILPVITFDNKFLYFDRKSHPENTGGLKDLDEIWFSEIKNNRFWTIPRPLNNEVNNKNSNVLFNISPDLKTALIYGAYDSLFEEGYYLFQRKNNHFYQPKFQKIENYINHSKNFFATINTSQDVMIITSIKENSVGGEDLFVTFKTENDHWSEPVNLGKQINTEYDEISPFIAYDNCHLYFSSNKKEGLGGFDLYVSRRLDSSWKNWSEPVNLGKIINSKFNETGFYTTKFSDTAYIISSETKVFPSNNDLRLYDTINYKHGIYRICIPKNLQPNPYLILTGKIKEYKSDKLIPVKGKINFKVDYRQNFHKDFVYTFYNEDDNYVLIILWKEEANIKIFAENYKQLEFVINTDTLNNIKHLTKDIILEPLIYDKPQLTLYFDTDVYQLSLDHKKKIDILASNIDNKFTKKIRLIGFADEIGTVEYNDTLSYNRALEVKKYLLKLGFNQNNISIVAKGEREANSKDPALNRKVDIYIR